MSGVWFKVLKDTESYCEMENRGLLHVFSKGQDSERKVGSYMGEVVKFFQSNVERWLDQVKEFLIQQLM